MDEPTFTAALAADPATPPEILQQISEHGATTLRALVAANPNTPLPTLQRLAHDYPQQFLANPILPLLLLENPQILMQLDQQSKLHLLRCEQCPAAFLAACQTSCNDPSITIAVALHVRVIGTAIRASNWLEMTEVVLNNVPFPDAFDDPTALLLQHSGLVPVWVVTAMAESKDPRQRMHAALCPDLPLPLLEQLAKDEHDRVRYAITQRPSLIDGDAHLPASTPAYILEWLAGDASQNVRREVASHACTPSAVLQYLAHDTARVVRKRVARNPHTPFAIVEQLARSGDKEVYRAACCHPAALAYLLKLYAKNVSLPVALRRSIAAHPQTPEAVLAQLAENSNKTASRSNRDVRALIAANTSTPATLLEQLADDKAKVRRNVASNPHTPLPILKRLAEDASVIEYLAINPQLPPDLIEYLYSKGEVTVYAHLAANPATPRNILERLACDPRVAEGLLLHPQLFTAYRDLLPSVLATALCHQPEDEQYRLPINFLILCCPEVAPAILLENAVPTRPWTLGYAVARNPSTPAHALEDLSQDGNILVRATARAALGDA